MRSTDDDTLFYRRFSRRGRDTLPSNRSRLTESYREKLDRTTDLCQCDCASECQPPVPMVRERGAGEIQRSQSSGTDAAAAAVLLWVTYR